MLFAEPRLSNDPLPTDSDLLDAEREVVLAYIALVARSDPPDHAEIEIPKACARLIEIVYAEYEAIAREDQAT
jgi:hypothetical protein